MYSESENTNFIFSAWRNSLSVSLSIILCAEDLAVHIKGIIQDVLSGEPGKAGMGSVQNRGRSVQRYEIGVPGNCSFSCVLDAPFQVQSF